MLYLHGIGHFYPENEITNAFLTELDIGTNDEWIVERTGIRSRRTVLPLDYIRETRNQDVRAADEVAVYSNAELSKHACDRALAQAGIESADIGMVVAGGSAPASVTPAEACCIAAALELDGVMAFDVRSACTSFGATLHMLNMMQPEAVPPYALVVMPETTTRVIDYNDRSSAVLWGDAAVAAVVSTTVPAPVHIESHELRSRPQAWDKVVVPWAGHFDQQGATVQTFAVKTTSKLLKKLQRQYGDAANGDFHFIGHQANLRMLETVCKRCEIAPERHHCNVAEYGNTATAGAPSNLSACWDSFGPGDHVAIVGVGGGLTWSSLMVRFEDPTN